MIKRNSRLSLALCTLSHMAQGAGRTQTSSETADHAGTNPVVARRVLGKLRKAGFVPPSGGNPVDGGWRDLRTTSQWQMSFPRWTRAWSPPVRTLNRILVRLSDILREVETLLPNRLSGMTIAGIGGSTSLRARQPCCAVSLSFGISTQVGPAKNGARLYDGQ